MAVSYDIIVIGGGLAGATAALEARRRGAQVALACRSWGATALSSGALDVGYAPALSVAQQTPRTIAEHVMDIVAHRPEHPYAVLGHERTIDGVRRGYSLLAKALASDGPELGALDLQAPNRGLPSTVGAVLPAAASLHSHVGIDFFQRPSGPIGVLQLRGDAHFDAGRIAKGLRHDALKLSGEKLDLRVVSVPFDVNGTPIMVARQLDSPAALDKLAAAIGASARGLEVLIVPPVFGLDGHREVWTRFSRIMDVPIVEALAHTPSVPGARLQRALERALRAASVDFFVEAVSPLVDDNSVRALRLRDGTEVKGSSFVLASGRFVAGGITRRERCREPLFDLPLVTSAGALESESFEPLVRERPSDIHPLLTAGVSVGGDLRPLREGRVAFENLYASGMVIGGFASRYALCADGVAMATGVLAAESALEPASANAGVGRQRGITYGSNG